MGKDGLPFVQKGGYFLLIWVKVCPKKDGFFLILNQFYELAFQTKRSFLQTRNPPLYLFLVFGSCIHTIVHNYCLKGRFLH